VFLEHVERERKFPFSLNMLEDTHKDTCKLAPLFFACRPHIRTHTKTHVRTHTKTHIRTHAKTHISLLRSSSPFVCVPY
jgi:hypothetical protein